MKLLENTKLTGAALILLLGLNSALLVVLIARKPPLPPAPMMPPPPPGPPMGGGARGFLIDQLSMTTVQQASYDSLIAIHRTKLETLMNTVKSTRDSLITELGAGKLDSANVQRLSARIGWEQQQIEQLNYYHFRDVRSICTDAQKPKFDSVIHDALRMMGPPNGGPPPPPAHMPPR
ncbi:MAG TPA: hypothetical protein VL651_15340 [Bacteroidia bacterium]|jgi:Spy/CpxP family protein refolding chaperone|nr:hypothetical protein [Bacteroidia bacterium]